MTSAVHILQVVVGVGLVIYAVGLIAARLPKPAWVRSTPRAPVDDLRLVIDLAARLRDAGRTDAVKVCQSLLDELLKPAERKP